MHIGDGDGWVGVGSGGVTTFKPAYTPHATSWMLGMGMGEVRWGEVRNSPSGAHTFASHSNSK